MPAKGSTEALEHVLRAKHLGLCMMTIQTTLPDGTSTVPMNECMKKDPELGVIWGKHAALTKEDKENLRRLVLQRKKRAFAYLSVTWAHSMGT